MKAIIFAPRLSQWYRAFMGNSQCCEAAHCNGECKSGPVQDGDMTPDVKAKPIPAGFVLLHGCTTMEQHEELVLNDLKTVGFQCAVNNKHVPLGKRLIGEEGLKAIGFEFRFVPCAKHSSDTTSADEVQDSSVVPVEELADSTAAQEEPKRVRFDFSSKNTDDRVGWHSCKACATRLFYVGTQQPYLNADANDSTLDKVCTSNNVVNNTLCPSDENDESNKSGVAELKANETNEQLYVSDNGDNLSAASKETTVSFGDTEQMTSVAEVAEATTHQDENDSLLQNVTAAAQKPTLITPLNRHTYIADGLHYELLSTLAQEAAHDIMRRTFTLGWVTVCNDDRHHEHVRALVDGDHPLALEEKEVVKELLGLHVHNGQEDEKKDLEECNPEQSTTHQRSTLLIATGRGKVRAGIFSRFHLLTAGIEVGTAWHNIREARTRGMGVVIIDPNARGEQEGMETFKRSVVALFTRAADRIRKSSKHEHETTQQHSAAKHASSIYILAHSASGGQLVRHLREDPSLLPSIQAIAFTDSTHNVQWCKNDPSLMEFLSTKNCIYLRSNDVRTSQSCIHVSSRGKDIACQCVNCKHNRKSAGVVADTDSFWEHRFGKIRTLWAGTADHALCNWAGHDHIWLHFDRHATKSTDA
ncbi:hypothetical protein ACHAXN_012266 [Cyclotella atomus]